MKEIIKLLRPHQYIKNLFLFAPLLFTFDINLAKFEIVLYGFILFSLSASAIYVLNDYHDITEDKVYTRDIFGSDK